MKGFLKRLKNIEDKSNNQLLAIKNIPIPAIKGNFRIDDEYKIIQDFKQGLIDKWKQTKDKEIVYKNVDAKVNTKKFNIYNIFENHLNKKIDYDGLDMIERNIKNGIKMSQIKPRTYINKRIINNSSKIIKAIELFKSMIINNEFIIPEEYIFKPNNNVDLDWMINKNGFEETAEDARKYYMKGKNDNKSKLIKDFMTKINNGTINKNEAENEFRKLKQKVTSSNLEHALIKTLEKDLFGEDIEPEEEYEKSIAERVKTRKQNTQKTFAPSSPSKIDYSKATADYLEYMKKEKRKSKKI